MKEGRREGTTWSWFSVYPFHIIMTIGEHCVISIIMHLLWSWKSIVLINSFKTQKLKKILKKERKGKVLVLFFLPKKKGGMAEGRDSSMKAWGEREREKNPQRWKCGIVVRTPLRTYTSCDRKPGFKYHLTSSFSFLLMGTLECNWWWLMYLYHCHICGRPSWYPFLASFWLLFQLLCPFTE